MTKKGAQQTPPTLSYDDPNITVERHNDSWLTDNVERLLDLTECHHL